MIHADCFRREIRENDELEILHFATTCLSLFIYTHSLEVSRPGPNSGLWLHGKSGPYTDLDGGFPSRFNCGKVVHSKPT